MTLLASALMAAALSATAPPADKSAPLGTPERPAEVTVTAPPPVDPQVVSTFPADGGKAAGGILVLKVTFDQVMVPQAWSFGQTAEGAFPHCLKTPRLLGDRKSFAILCSVAPNLAYALQINAAPDFVSARGRSAKPYRLRFTTTGETVYDMHAALKQAGLTDADEPIMTWNAQPGGVSDEPPPPRADR